MPEMTSDRRLRRMARPAMISPILLTGWCVGCRSCVLLARYLLRLVIPTAIWRTTSIPENDFPASAAFDAGH